VRSADADIGFAQPANARDVTHVDVDGGIEVEQQLRGIAPAQLLVALLGRATRTSEGSLGAAGPRPREFTDERSGRDTARARFDWSAKTMTLRYKGRSRTEPIPPNAQDRLSFILALSAAPAGSKTGDYHLVDGRGVSHHIYEFRGRERVQTAAGEFDALKVVRGTDDERTEIWLAGPLGGLPVRMLAVEKGGTRWDQVATRIER